MSEKCKHDEIEAFVALNRIEDIDRYMADVTITCAKCKTPFRFIGLPAGVDFNSPTVSIDACKGSFPVAPKGEVLSELEGTPIGFTIRKGK